MNWLRKKETKQIKKEELLDPTTISVESIQGILVKEFELNSTLKEELEMSKHDLEEIKQIANEYKLKYEATLLVAHENEMRLEKSNRNVKSNDYCIQVLNNELSTLKKEKDSYYLKCKEYEKEKKTLRSTIENQYKDENKEELIYHLNCTRDAILSSINMQDSRASKTKLIEIVNTCFNKGIGELQTVAHEDGDNDAF